MTEESPSGKGLKMTPVVWIFRNGVIMSFLEWQSGSFVEAFVIHTGPEAMLLENKSTPKTNNAVK